MSESEWDIRPEDLTPAQQQVADLIGFDNYAKLIDVYAADTIYIPKKDSFERIVRNQKIIEEFNGYNFAALAKRYNLTSVTIRRIVEDKRKLLQIAPISGQTCMFD